MEQYLWLIPLGFVLGTFGTLIGAGGGFVLVPILLLLYPRESPEIITSISLAVVFINALSGSAVYARMRRIDYKSGLLFGTATIPAAILGASTTAFIPRRLFYVVFGFLMIAASVVLMLRTSRRKEVGTEGTKGKIVRYGMVRYVVGADGKVHAFSYNPIVGVGLSLFIGYFSSLLGIGGGPIQVPALVHVLNFPVHIATATSQFTLMIMASTGTLVHLSRGVFSHGVWRTVALGLGALLGAQLGARLSNHVHGEWIIRVLAIALGFVGVRIVLTAL